MNQGSESAYYLKMSNNQTDKLWREEVLVEDPFENRLLTEKFTDEAIRYIKEHRSEAFFLYLPYTAPHFRLNRIQTGKGNLNTENMAMWLRSWISR